MRRFLWGLLGAVALPAVPLGLFALLILAVLGWFFAPFQAFAGGPPQGLDAITVTYLPAEQAAVQQYAIPATTQEPVTDAQGHVTGYQSVTTSVGITVPFLQAVLDAASGGNTALVQEQDGVTTFGIAQLPLDARPTAAASPFDPGWQISALTQALDQAYRALGGNPADLAAYAYALMTDPAAWQAGRATLAPVAGAARGTRTPGGPAFVSRVLADLRTLGTGPVVPGESGPTGAAGLQPWACLVQQVSRQTGVPAAWIGGEILAESGGRADAGYLAGAYGLMQLEPGTMGATDAEREDPATNVLLGALYLASLERETGSWELASAAYYGGLGTLAAALRARGLALGVSYATALASGALDVVPFPQAGNTLTLAAYVARVQADAAGAQDVLAQAACSPPQ
ncbi:MAG: transglycosylase SLT domain-containing protein [Actinomycetia bacterium]|nr:transglycosylase SLT domain-containing protein [Actinomycetes bacterium]